MSARVTRYLALSAGLALMVAGLTVPFWMASAGIGDIQAAQILNDNQAAHWLHVLMVPISGALITPVMVLLGVRLYPLRPALSLVGVAIFLFGLILEAVGTVSSLARFGGAVTGAMNAEALWIAIYHTLTALYMAVTFAGAAMVYLAGVILAVALWRHHRLSSIFLAATVVVFIIALFLPSFYSTIGLGVSIAIYGVAYGALGYATVDLAGSRETPLKATAESTAAKTATRSQRSRRSGSRRRR